MKKGFTLIELLIVVAIIGILAAIAVPNFLNAMTRSQIARVKADLKAWNQALESYNLDHNAFPTPAWFTEEGNAFKSSHSFNRLTTPIAYLSSPMFDPFQSGIDPTHGGKYMSHDGAYIYGTWRTINNGIINIKSYQIQSFGPDKFGDNFGPDSLWNLYSATNGLVSRGDITFFSKFQAFGNEIGLQRLLDEYG